ncbi:hypothetical protein RUND412_009481 [Rhizina undulata]
MADIEDRIRGHTNAFQGLLSLLPEASSPSKRKQPKDESKKVKRSKLNPDSTGAGEVLKRKRGDNEGEKAEGGEKNEGSEEKVKKKQKQKPQKPEKPAGEKKGNSTSNPETPQKKPGKIQQKQKQSKASEKTPNGTSNLKTPEKAEDEEIDQNETEAARIEVDVSFITDVESPESTSEDSRSDEPAPASTPKIELDPEARAKARARLVARIEALRSKRKADGPDGTPARNRQELMEARRKKEAARKQRKQELRLQAKAEQSKKGPERKGDSNEDVEMKDVSAPQRQPANNFAFGKVMFDDGEQLDPSLQNFQKSRKRKGPTDVVAQMKQVEAKKARLASMDEEKAQKIQEKDKWSKALKQANGEKVRDDEKLLKKALKRQEKAKKKSEKAWRERTENVAKSKAIRAKKREDNINARKEQKKLGKAGKKVKSAGKKKVQMKKKKGVARPGFEGSMKSGPKAGGNKKEKKSSQFQM